MSGSASADSDRQAAVYAYIRQNPGCSSWAAASGTNSARMNAMQVKDGSFASRRTATAETQAGLVALQVLKSSGRIVKKAAGWHVKKKKKKNG